MHHLQTLHERLCSLRDDGPTARIFGICQVCRDEASYTKQLLEDALRDAFRTWPEFGGDPSFPVPHTDMTACDAFYEIEDVWEGEYGAARRRLLDHCIVEIGCQLSSVTIKQLWYVEEQQERCWFEDDRTARTYLLLVRAAFKLRPGIDLFLGRDVPPVKAADVVGFAT